MTTRLRFRSLVPALLMAAVLAMPLAGCSGDDGDGPVDPPPPDPPAGGRLVPEDYPTLIDALAAAAPGDTVSLAAGTYTVDASLDRAVTIRARTTGEVALTGSRLTVRAGAGAGGAVRLVGLAFSGGDTALVVQGASDVSADSCSFTSLVCGVLHTGSGILDLNAVSFDAMSGGALHTVDAGRVTIDGLEVTASTAGERGVIWSRGTSDLVIRSGRLAATTAAQAVLDLETTGQVVLEDLAFEDCGPYPVRRKSGPLTMTGCRFNDLTAPAVGLGPDAATTIDACEFARSTWPAIEAAGTVTLTGSAFVDGRGDGAAILVTDGAEVTIDRATFHGAPGPWLRLGSGAVVAVSRTLVTDLAVPAIVREDLAPAQLTLDQCDLWHPSLAAWTGLEFERDAGEGNLETDPLYCDPGAWDLRLQAGSPVAGWGAFGVGCE
ncbi:hypothetical protein GF314_03165 [bacterium]|nr:hypothetical protein [bacterium]